MLSILLMLAFWGRAFFIDIPIEIVESQTFLYSILFDWTKTHTMLAKTLAFVCVFLQAFMLSEVFRTHSLSKNPMLIGLVYIVLMSAQSSWQTMHPFLISNFFIIGGFSYLFKIYDRKEAYEFVFNVGILFALAALISPSLLPFAFVVCFVFLFYPIYKWREWLIGALGFGLPFFALFLWTSLTENTSVLSEFLIPIAKLEDFSIILQISRPFQIFMVLVLVLSLVGVRFLNFRAKNKEISQRKKIMATTLGLLWAAIVVIFMFEHALVYLATSFVISAFFIAEWLGRSQREWLSEVMLYTLVIVAFGVPFL